VDQRGPVVEETRQSQTRLSASNRRELLVAYTAGVPVHRSDNAYRIWSPELRAAKLHQRYLQCSK